MKERSGLLYAYFCEVNTKTRSFFFLHDPPLQHLITQQNTLICSIIMALSKKYLATIKKDDLVSMYLTLKKNLRLKY